MKNVLVAAVTLLLSYTTLSYAGDGIELSPVTYKKVVKAREYIAEEKFKDAEEVLLKQKERTRNSKYDRLEVLRTLGYLYATQEQFGKATKTFEEAIATRKISLSIKRELRYNLSQMYMAEGNFGKAAEQLEQYLVETKELRETPTAGAYIALANSYAQLSKYRKVIAPASQAISISKEPREGWYQLLLAAHYELKEYSKAADILELLVKQYPNKKKYWKQLASMYLQDKKDSEALAVSEMAYKKGLFEDEKEYIHLANFLSYRETPFKAGKVMENGLRKGIVVKSGDNYKKLANFWRQARENRSAIEAFEQALTFKKDAKVQLDLAYLLVDIEDYSKLITLVDGLAVDATDKQRAKALLLKGQALYNLDQPREALAVMRDAAQLKDSEKDARRWVSFLSSSLE